MSGSMSFRRRLRLDLSPALGALLALSGVMVYCDLVSGGDFPWSVEAAFGMGMRFCLLWWVWSDTVRRRYALMPVWGTFMVLDTGSTTLVYLFASRGWWGIVTLVLYAVAFTSVSWLVAWLV